LKGRISTTSIIQGEQTQKGVMGSFEGEEFLYCYYGRGGE
jgi:hypothetical protein